MIDETMTQELPTKDLPIGDPPAEVIEDPELEELHQTLVRIGEDFDQEDESFRTGQVRELKKNLLFWEGAQRLFWSENEDSWVNANGLMTPADRSRYGLDGNSDRVINIYRPHGESIVAAMSVGTPVVQFFPEDADNPDDITAAKAYSKIATILHKHNRGQLLFIKALFILYNQGLVAGYNYTHRSDKYGTYESDKVADVAVEEDVWSPIDGSINRITTIIPQVVGKESNNKVRECLELYGPLHVSVPSWCRKQEDVPVLRLQFEQHVSTIRAAYPEKFDEISPNYGDRTSVNERGGRLSGDNDESLVTLTVRWFRPTAYASVDKDSYDQLSARYPKGAKVVSIDHLVLECVEESIDDHWTLTFPVFSETIHQKSQGSGVIDIQEIRNDVVNNVDEAFRQAISETFADPKVLSFPNYNATPKRPGQLFPAIPQGGKSLADGFHSLRTASVPPEADTFIKRLDSDAQFTSGAFPSIFGGQNTSGSKTAAEYAQSRAQALQRLSTYWKMMCEFWAQFMGRASVNHARNLVQLNYDEKIVEKTGQNFVNVFVKRAELEGKVGRVEPETSDNFPISSGQKRELLMSLLQVKNEVIERLMYHPENSQVILEAIGMPEIHLPGADDRTKQLEEIGRMVKAAPLDEQTSSEPIEHDVDDDGVHIQITRAWMVSELGQFVKESKPEGYLNVMLHLKAHLANQTSRTQMPSGETNPGEPPPTNATGPV